MAGGKIIRQLAKHPGVGGRGPANHDRVAAGLVEERPRIFGLVDVAVADHRDSDALLDLADEFPTRSAAETLEARARVDRDGFDAGVLGELRHLDGDDFLVTPAGTNLDREGNFHRTTDSMEDSPEKRQVPQ